MASAAGDWRYDWDRWQAEVHGLEAEEGRRQAVQCMFPVPSGGHGGEGEGAGNQRHRDDLTISPRKRPEVINPIGRELCEELGIRFHEADWKKQDGFKQSVDTSKELHIYRQRYCGCKYSLKEREEQEAEKATRLVAELAGQELPGKRKGGRNG